MCKKWNTETVKSYLEKHFPNYILHSEYTVDKAKVTILCPNGHMLNLKWSSFRNSNGGCMSCYNDRREKEHLDSLYNAIEDSNYKIIKFVEKRRILVQCLNNHTPYEVKTSNFITGKRCRECSNEKLREERKLSYEHVKNYIEKDNGYVLISKEYINNEEHLEMVCPNGHSYFSSFNNFKSGYRCGRCSGCYKIDYEEAVQRIEKFGFKMLSPKEDYVNTRTNVNVMCSNGHKLDKSVGGIFSGAGCMKCSINNRTGDKSSSWKGGISETSEWLRSQIKEWKYSCLKKSNFKCSISGNSGNLEIHHLEPFSYLVSRMFKITNIEKKKFVKDYSLEEKEIMRNCLAELHKDVAGVVLNKDIHKMFHMIFGFHDNNENQFIFFRDNYDKFKSGEYNVLNYKRMFKKGVR